VVPVTTIKILGTGCPKCHKLAENAAAALRELGLEAAVEKVTDLDAILAFGVIMTPALVVDGVVVASGKVPSVGDIKRMVQARSGADQGNET